MLDMRKGKCALCGHGKVLQAPAFEFYGDGGFFERPSSVTFEKSAFLTKSVTKIAPLTMYVCRSCGFVQWFAENPQTVPIDKDHHTRLVARRDEDDAVDSPAEDGDTSDEA
jgi:hypothetical protein